MRAWPERLRAGAHRTAEPGLSALGHLAATALLALAVHQAAHGLPFPGGTAFSTWLPLGFGVQSLAVTAVTWSLPRGPRLGLRLADLSTWLVPLAYFVHHLFAPSSAELWVALAALAKAGAGAAAVVVATKQRAPRLRLAGWCLAALMTCLYLVPVPLTRMTGATLTGDEPHYLLVTVSLVQDHDFYIEDEVARKAWLQYSDFKAFPPQAVYARGGHLALWHEPGLSILAVVPYLLGGWRAVLGMLALLAGLVVREVFLMTLHAGLDPPAAAVTAALLGATIPLVLFATQVFPEVPVALAVAVALRQVWAQGGEGRGSALVTGLALATLPWLHVQSWGASVPLALGSLLVWRPLRSRLAAAVPLAVSALLYVGFNWAVYGRPALSPLQGPMQRLVTGVPGAAEVVIAYARLWLDPNEGLVVIAPLTLLALAGLPALCRRGPAGFVNLAGFAGYTALLAAYALFEGHGWSSGAGAGPPGRYSVPLIPLLGAPLGLALRAAWRRGGAVLVQALAAASLLEALTALGDLHHTYPTAIGEGPLRMLGKALSLPVSGILARFSPDDPGSWARTAILGAAVLTLALALNMPAPRRSAARAGAAPPEVRGRPGSAPEPQRPPMR